MFSINEKLDEDISEAAVGTVIEIVNEAAVEDEKVRRDSIHAAPPFGCARVVPSNFKVILK